MRRLPDDVAWKVVRDLSDIATSFAYLDANLAELLPASHPASAVLADADSHGVLRVAAVEAQTRIEQHLVGVFPRDPAYRPLGSGTRLTPPSGVSELPR
jgi:hypothetical protein